MLPFIRTKITLLYFKHWHYIFVTFHLLNSPMSILGLQQNYRRFLKTKDLTDVDLNLWQQTKLEFLTHVTRTLGPSQG